MGLYENVSYFSLTTFKLGGGGIIKQGEIFYNLDLARKTWGANNSVYGTYAKLLQFNDYYKGIVLFLSCDK